MLSGYQGMYVGYLLLDAIKVIFRMLKVLLFHSLRVFLDYLSFLFRLKMGWFSSGSCHALLMMSLYYT